MIRWARVGLVLGVLGGVIACGSDGKGGGGSTSNAPSYVGEEAEVELKAGEAGELEAGAVKLAIPSGALVEDATVTVEVKDKKDYTDSDKIAVDVYEFGPALEFAEDVSLEFDMEGISLKNGDTVEVAWFDEESKAWRSVPTTVDTKSGKAIGKVRHFTPFTLVFKLNEKGELEQTGGQCGGDSDEFEACGGDLVGTWEFSVACATVPTLGRDDDDESKDEDENPFKDCKEQPTLAASTDISGTITFADDMSYSSAITLAFEIQFVVPNSCVEQLGGGCEMGGGTQTEDSCVVPIGDDEEPETETEEGTWSAEGDKVTIGDDDPARYCVDGDKLTLRYEKDDGSIVEMVAERQ